ncbi:head-tail adaptor protein [Rhodovulum adriaticum]|uniref:Head-tail adaptor n=1 Tax=Rhodovulum adriaticum TaxID=35804 RepID=A0A4R2NUA2_RHOAD|nr:head-tail adaptor protein [Rhodovulum adriaticum]MBK1636160.1 phage tail protein [Rhodovulum adriaticum]TCP25477.1 head-tail adaptor [Rhodovulum adriaticum]
MSGARRLSRKLVLEAPERVADGAGGFTETWVARGTLWAEVSPRTGGARTGQGVSLSRVGYRIVVRGAPVGAPSRPVPGQRFREGARLFAIRAVTEADPQGRYLTCFAEEEDAT